MFSQELFADIVTTYSFCFKTSAENSPWMKINCMESCLGTCRFTYQNVVYYILLWIFSVFLASLMVVSIKIGYQCVFCFNLMNNSFLLKYRELRLLALFLLIILEMRSSAALECAACVCLFVCFVFFQKSMSLGKNPLKNCKPVKWRTYRETVRKTPKPYDTRWNRESSEVWHSQI